MRFTWKKGSEEKVKFQNENENWDMNQEDFSLFANSPKQI